MAIGVFDLFKIGIGPSSSHTVGPMRAARRFALELRGQALLGATARVRCELFGSLGATGRGHGSDRAVLLGLEGEEPDRVEPACIGPRVDAIRAQRSLRLLGQAPIAFDEANDLVFNGRERLPFHPNGMRFAAFGGGARRLLEKTYFSTGGGFIAEQDGAGVSPNPAPGKEAVHPFGSAADLLALCGRHRTSIAALMWRNEIAERGEKAVREGLLRIWGEMQDCVRRGIAADGDLPGGARVPRRAPALHRRLAAGPVAANADPLLAIDWVNLYALAVNEENAAGGRVVTAPTNGAAGIVPAVLHYYWRFLPGAHEQGVLDFLLTAAAIGLLYKNNASISGAEVGCQGEVGVACSMAAAALCAVMGGTPAQVENAAEIGMEHHLGLTCDPVGGLVQIPCIERNALAAVKAINASRMALHGDGTHRVSLDQVIRTMRDTGADMQAKYKETALGGLAVSVVGC